MHNFRFRPTLKFDSEFSYRQAITNRYPIFTPSPEPYSVSGPPDSDSLIHHRFERPYEPSYQSNSVDQSESVLVSDDRITSFDARELSTPVSQRSDYSFASSFIPLDAPVPPSRVELSDYYKCVPPGLTPLQKTQQLIIWLAKREANKEIAPETQVDPRAIRAKRIAKNLKRKVIEGLERGDVHLSWYNRPDKMEQFEEKENPINLYNAGKLAALSRSNALTQAEIDDWKIYSGRVYQAHAEAKDAILQDTSLCYDDIDVGFMLPHLDEQQQKFYLKYCSRQEEEKEEEAMFEQHSVIYPGVTQIRHTLNTANQFTLASQRFIHCRRSNLARQVCEKARIIPTEYDHQYSEGVFYDEKHKKDSELRNIPILIRFSKNSAE